MNPSSYERGFAELVGTRHAFAFWKGRVAMYAILKGLGVGEGDEVIVPGYTCVMNVNPIFYLRARPVYIDIEPDTFNLDPALLPGLITPRTKAIIAQHTYGYAADLDAIRAVAEPRGIPIIEDCCLALGSGYRGQRLGTIGRAAYFSSQWNKPYTTGIGGMAVTRDDELAGRIRELIERDRQEPRFKETAMLTAQLAVYRSIVYPRTTALIANVFRWLTRRGLVVGSSSTAEFAPAMADDFFKGMSGVQVRSGVRQLHRAMAGFEHRRRMTAVYDRLLAEAGFPPRRVPEHTDPVMVRYPVRVADKERALAEAAGHYVELGSWFECPLHPIETPLQAYDYTPGLCPLAERACREVVNLPTHPRADAATAERTVRFIRSIGPADPN